MKKPAKGAALAALTVALLTVPAHGASAAVPLAASVSAGVPSLGQAAASVGATTPFIEYQAERGKTNGEVIGPDWAYGTLAAEAVERKAVKLQGTGRYVEFTLAKAANAANIRYSIPDSADGAGIDSTLGVEVGGKRISTLSVTSRYSWYYGVFPWSNNPADGGRRQLYDDSRVMFGKTLPAGTKVRLQVGAADTAPWYVIDVADFENVSAPAQKPRGAVSIADFGADPTGAKNSSDAIQRALDSASGTGKTVWIPRGTFTVTRHLIVDKVTVTGAGPWYSILHGKGVGVYGKYNPTPTSNVHLSSFAIFGEVQERNDSDQVNGIGGTLGDSTIDNIWIQHTKVGGWFDGPFTNLKITRARILDQTADGINFHDGITNSSVTDSFIRNTGDDGMAMWSDQHPDTGNTFARNTVRAPILANTIGIYGGSDNTVANNLLTDTVTQGSGVQVANRFGSVPLAGTTTVDRNVLERTGSLDLFSHIGNGALLFWAVDSPITGTVKVTRNLIHDSAYEAIQFLGSTITNTQFDQNLIDKTGTFALQLNTSGAAGFRHVLATRLGAAGRYDCDSGFVVTDLGGNHGWNTSKCGYPAPGALTVTKFGDNLLFKTDALGSPSDPQTVTITNPTSTPARIASVTITGAFTVSTTCGAALAPGATCTATVRFVPTQRGDRQSALTISDGTPAGRYQIYVRGQVIAPTVGNLAAGKPVTASSAHADFPASNTTDSNTDTYWEGLGFPVGLTVDLGESATVARVQLKLNGGWGGRTQNVQVLGSNDGTTFTSIVPTADYTFDPTANNNTVVVNFAAAQFRYLQVVTSSNNGATSAQIAEYEVYASPRPEPGARKPGV
jgi:alpha-1,3-glucanase-like protein/F5/8 type C domain-containing protein